MADTEATVDAAVTPAKEQLANGDAGQAEEEGVNGQQPESMSTLPPAESMPLPSASC